MQQTFIVIGQPITHLIYLVSWGRRRWYLRCVEQKTWTRLWRTTGGWYTHVRRQSLLACKRIVRFHRRFAFKYRRTGFPSVRVRPLANLTRRSAWTCQQTVQHCTGRFQTFVFNFFMPQADNATYWFVIVVFALSGTVNSSLSFGFGDYFSP